MPDDIGTHQKLLDVLKKLGDQKEIDSETNAINRLQTHHLRRQSERKDEQHIKSVLDATARDAVPDLFAFAPTCLHKKHSQRGFASPDRLAQPVIDCSHAGHSRGRLCRLAFD